MPPSLPRSVLVALGLTAGCDRCHSAHVGPCLDMPTEPAPEPEPEEEDTPELELPPEEHLGPCLNMIIPSEWEPEPEPEPEDEPAPEPEGEQGALDAPRSKVLARGVLPEDVAALLRQKRG